MMKFFPSSYLLVVVILTLSLLSSTTTAESTPVHAPDTNEQCKYWSSIGECDKNPAYMLPNCATSCGSIIDAIQIEKEQLSSITSIYDFTVNDIHGTPINFGEQYRNQVLIIINVASYCGYTESHYNGLNELYNTIQQQQQQQQQNPKIQIIAFPCNQFGQQEPGSAKEIQQFVQEKNVQFTIMEKINVNGRDAHLLYKYLKEKTNVETITWNFATYFVVAPDGVTITAHNGIQPMELQPIVFSLVSSKEEL